MCSVSELPGVRLRGLGAARGPFRRCLCWCCCCSCNGSCLAVRNGEDNGPTKKEPGPTDVLLCDGEPPPSIEEIQSWGKSFDKLMRSAAGRKVFRDFLRCEYSEENILFWLACEELKRESNPDAVEEKARFIYEDYISILSPKEVSLDSRVREVVNRNMVEPTPHTFDEAQLQIYTLMHRDSYPRFVNSALYKTLAQVASSSGASGGGGGAVGEEETLSSPDSNKLSPSERRASGTEGGKDESSNKKEETLNTKEGSSGKKEGSTEKKGVTWENLEEPDKKECTASKKEVSSDKNDISEKKEINTQKEETISQSLVSKKDFESSLDRKQSGSDKKEGSVEKKDSATGKTESGPSKKDGGLQNNLA